MIDRLTCSVLASVMLLASAMLVTAPAGLASVRVKDIADFEGIRDNVLVGYGLVVGLNGTGDSLRNATFTEESLKAMLERLGVSTRGRNLRTQNVAAVMVTATLPPFARQGSRIDVGASALGDAKSLLGGTLLVTPLIGADGEVYAVAQGALTIGGFEAEGDAETITRGVPTAGRIPAGAIVEREIDFELDDIVTVKLALRNPDLTTAQRIAAAVNAMLDGNQPVQGRMARASDPTTVSVRIPTGYIGRTAEFLTEIEQLRVVPDTPARIVIDESNGIIVMGENVRVSKVAVAQGNLTVRVTETPQVSQPNPFAEGETVEVPRTDIEVDDQDDRKMVVLESGVTLEQLVDGLNALGVGPRDMISIIQAIRAAGALQAEIGVM